MNSPHCSHSSVAAHIRLCFVSNWDTIGHMDTNNLIGLIASSVIILGAVGTMWWQLDGKIDREIKEVRSEVHADIQELRAEVRTLSQLVTDNLLVLTSSVGELRGQAHAHTPPSP